MVREPAPSDEEDQGAQPFEQEAAEPQAGLLTEFIHFLRHNKKWWITPIILVLLALAILAVLGGSPAAAPFIYSF
jgi:hypothetical protein